MPHNDVKTKRGNRDAPPMRSADGNDRGSPSAANAGDDSAQAPTAPKTSGASVKNVGLSKSRVADRNPDGKREAGVTPRPTDDRRSSRVMTSEPISRGGGCLCGAVCYTLTGPPLRTGICHCLDCRKASGSHFTPFGVWPASAFECSGEMKVFAKRSLCPACGSRIAWASGWRGGDHAEFP
jgi:hypothetical protein